MFRLTRVLDWFCLDEREKRARSAIGRKRFKSPSLEAPDTRSLVVHRLSCSELSFFEAVSTLSKSLTGRKPANKLVESAPPHSLRRGNFYSIESFAEETTRPSRERATTTH
jgi:hypothetical protein